MTTGARLFIAGMAMVTLSPLRASADERWLITLGPAQVRGEAIQGTQLSAGFGVEFAPAPPFSLGVEIVSGATEFRTESGTAQGSIGPLMIKAMLRSPELKSIRGVRPFVSAGLGWLQSFASSSGVVVLDRDASCSSIGGGIEGNATGRVGWRFEVDRVVEWGSGSATASALSEPFHLWRLKAFATIRVSR